MKPYLILFTLCTTAGAALVSSQPTSDVKPVWHTDWPTAQRLAKEAKKPILAILVCKH
ncbi:MAG: hypothetical protein HY289_09910 [Planctomycetes bacterium]|nr:hypothetical protein [Planctomycetota bacterium]